MPQFTKKDVTFNNVPVKTLGSIMDSFLTQANIDGRLTEEYLNSEDFYTLINAVDIDWNDITLEDGTVISDTADLVNLIQQKITEADLPDYSGDFQNFYDGIDENRNACSTLTDAVDAMNENFAEFQDNTYNKQEVDELVSGYAVKSAVDSQIDQVSNELNTFATQADEKFATKTELETAAANAVAQIVANAPEDFDTLKEVADYIASDKTKATEIETSLGKKVDWTESTPGRNHIVLKNHDSILGTATDEQTYNLAMVSKWDVADFGTSNLHANLNTSDTVTINDNKVIATLDDLNEAINNISLTPGADGAQGVTGAQGPQGEAGADGIQGITGIKGEVGPQGATGIQGEVGPQGATGAQGEVGPQGATGAQGEVGPQGATGTFDDSALAAYATIEYVDGQITDLIGGATGTLDTLKEIADKLTAEDDVVAGLLNDIASKANAADVYTKTETDDAYATKDVVAVLADKVENIQEIVGPQGATGAQGEVGPQGATGAQGEVGPQGATGAQGEVGPQGATGAQGEVGPQGATGAQGEVGPQGATGAQGEVGPQGATGTFDDSALADYATIEYVDDTFATKDQLEAIVGVDVPENFDTLKELADVMDGLKVVDVEAVEPVEGVKWTQEEIDAAQEGDEAYGKTVDDWKVEPVEGVEEQSHNMTISEFVTSSMEAVDEKAAVAKVQAKYEALLSLLNIRESQVNSVIVNQELEESSTVTFEEPVDNIVIPETTAAYVVTGPLDDNSTVTLTSNKYMTLDNTSEEPVSATVQRPTEAGETGTSGTTVYLVGQYDTLTLENVSPNVKSGRDAAVVNNVVITENNTKNLTLNLDLQDGATITNNSATAVTINDKNDESTVLAIVAPNSTVTLNGGTYTTLNAEVSDNTLIIKKNAHIGTLNVTKGNVTVEVPRQSDIANIIDNLNIAEGYTVDYLHDDITAANISKLTTTGTHTFQEDLTKSGNFSVGLFSSDDMVWDLNGHNLTSSNTRGYGIFTLRGTAQLEINDTVGTGVVKNTADEYGFWTSTVGSKVVINGGNFEAATHVLYAQKGTIEVNGGTFKLTDAATADKDQNGNFKFLLNCHDEDYVSGDAKIIVRGGKFYGFNPAVTYGEPGGPVSYVPAGYESVPTNEAYEYGTVYEVRPITQ